MRAQFGSPQHSDILDHLERYRDTVPDFDEFVSIQAKPLPSSVRINSLKVDRSRLLDRFDRAGIAYEPLLWYNMGLRLGVERPGKTIENMLGYIHIQEEVSMVPPLVLDPKAGEKILDLCAAPGSKTTQISQAMENKGLIIANEPSLSRLPSLRANCERLGVLNVAITRYDGRRFPQNQFDRVLVDAPCSGEGMARKDPLAIGRCSLNRSLDLQVLQIGLLQRAVALTRPGGIIIYSTCTYAPEENEAVVEAVLRQEREKVGLEDISVPGLIKDPGLIVWNGTRFSDEMQRAARYYPHKNDTGGFFVAKLARR